MIGQLLDRAVSTYGELTAYVDGDTRLTYADVSARVDDYARARLDRARLDPAKPGEMSQVSGGGVELVDVGGDRLVESVEVAA